VRIYKITTFIFISLWASLAQAVLKIDITQGNVDPMPVAIGEFFVSQGTTSSLSEEVRLVIENDLRSSGLFRPIDKNGFLEMLTIDKTPNFISWRQIGALAFTSGRISETGDKVTVEFRLWDPAMEKQIEGSSFTLPKSAWRRGAHKIADQIYKRLTGEDGYFDTRVLFIAESGPMTNRMKKLAIMDQDGANYKELSDGKHMVITPRFDPKVHRAIYMSYKSKVPQVYLLDIHSGSQRLIGNFPGMSFAPRFAPDGNYAIMSVAKDGTTDIYEVNLNTSGITKLTSGTGTINTSPSYSPDGSQIVFTSDRGGSEQIYVMNRDGSNVKRISFGNSFSYSTPVWSPRGDFIAFTTRARSGMFGIGVIRPDGSGERLLTSSWMDEGPTWAPNGRVIMFSRQQKGAGYHIYAVDVTGYNERLLDTPTDASDPAWSPLLG
jgi:TolB protein